MTINSRLFDHSGLAFDPYPFIFLNLMLSMLAAIQASAIMMSQNRQAAKDRMTEKLDYEINLRAELEIMRLHEKIAQMRIHDQGIGRASSRERVCQYVSISVVAVSLK